MEIDFIKTQSQQHSLSSQVAKLAVLTPGSLIPAHSTVWEWVKLTGLC